MTDTKYETLYDYFVLVNDLMEEANKANPLPVAKGGSWSGE